MTYEQRHWRRKTTVFQARVITYRFAALKLAVGRELMRTPKKAFIIGSIIWLAVFITALWFDDTHAQPPACDFAMIDNLLDISSEAIDNGDDAVTLDALSDLSREIRMARASCAGLSFSSEADGQLAVIGPVTLDAGIWIATATSESIMGAQITVIDGDCEDGYIFSILQGSDGQDTVVESEGCTMLLEISNAVGAWTLVFEKVA